MVKCEECSQEFEERKKLHYHLRTHKVSQQEYYHKHFPKFDLYTGEIITFKNYEDYESKFFEKKGNLSRYISTNSTSRVKQVLEQILDHRINSKGLTWEMSEVELISLEWPFKKQIEFIYGDFSIFFQKLNKRYKVPDSIAVKNPNAKIFIDTREQKPYVFEGCSFEITNLNFGDYACEIDGKEGNIHVERKNMMDFIQSFSATNYQRLKKEFQRAEVCGKNIVVLVEKDLGSMLSFDKMPRIQRFVRASPEHIFHNVRQAYQEFRNVQFLFVKDKEIAKTLCKTILLNECLFEYDLQYLYNMKLLNVV
jgi:hypothetical protein